jgi:WD40 repeat protein
LVNTPNGPWIVHADGTRQYLGPYTAAAWSPHSLYVIAWHRSQLAALNPQGHQQWTLASRAQVTVARWSPDGYRIAYTAGRWLRIVAGDGSNDRQLASIVTTVAPAWQPHTGPEHRVAYLDHAGYIELRDADTRALVWRSKPRALPQRLLWSPDGTRLLTVEAHRLSLYDPRGRLITTSTIASGDTAGPAAFAAGHRLAMILRPVDETANSVVLLDATKRGFRRVPQTVFTAPEQLTGIDWSPDHQWLITASASADQWIFIRVTAPTRLSAVSEIAKQLRPKHGGALGSPLLAGWQS